MDAARALRRLAAAVALLVAPLVGCAPAARSGGDLRMECRLEPDPPVVGPLVAELGLADSAGRPLAGADVRVTADMSHPGMVPVLARAREVAPGRHRAELTLTMAGDWLLTAEARLPDGRTIERSFPMRAVRSP